MVDAQDLGSCVLSDVEVRVLSSAHKRLCYIKSKYLNGHWGCV